MNILTGRKYEILSYCQNWKQSTSNGESAPKSSIPDSSPIVSEVEILNQEINSKEDELYGIKVPFILNDINLNLFEVSSLQNLNDRQRKY